VKRLAITAVGATDAIAVATLRPPPAQLAGTLAHPRAALAQRGPDGALLPVVGALTWLVGTWLAVGLLAVLVAQLPGVAGRAGSAASRVLLPRALRALLTGSAGLGVLLAPVAAIAAPPPAPGGSPAWPVSSAPTTSPVWPTGHTDPSGKPPTSTRPTTPPPTTPPPTAAGPVTVRPGDTLWTIAAGRLGRTPSPARVAAAWPRWFAANRAVVGSDPDLIHPGQVLQPPRPLSPSQPAPEVQP